MKGWTNPASVRIYQDKFELSGVTDLEGKIETVDDIGIYDRKLAIVIECDACVIGLRGGE